jgi:hypothetical protein
MVIILFPMVFQPEPLERTLTLGFPKRMGSYKERVLYFNKSGSTGMHMADGFLP